MKCIELFVAQAVMPDCEEHFYHGASQSFVDILGFHESDVSVDPEGACYEVALHGFKFIIVSLGLATFGFGIHRGGFVCALVRRELIATYMTVLYQIRVLHND
jgi:hypothetical protein